MKITGNLEFEVDTETRQVQSVLSYDVEEVDELTIVSLLGHHMVVRGQRLVDSGIDWDRTDNQLVVMLGDPDDPRRQFYLDVDENAEDYRPWEEPDDDKEEGDDPESTE